MFLRQVFMMPVQHLPPEHLLQIRGRSSDLPAQQLLKLTGQSGACQGSAAIHFQHLEIKSIVHFFFKPHLCRYSIFAGNAFSDKYTNAVLGEMELLCMNNVLV